MIRAIGWDHPRCVEPMTAAAAAWEASTGVAVAWSFRSLADFNDQPLSELTPSCDVLVVDHPAIPEAVVHGALAPLEQLLDPARVERLSAEAFGPNGGAYRCDGATWALPVDAACQVSAYHRRRLGEPLPATWPAVLALAERRPGAVAMPLLPADALCALVSIAATFGQPLTPGGAVPVEAVTVLAQLAPRLHPASWECAPPQLLARMAADEPIAYVPLTFGYCGLATDGLRFADAPAAPDGRRAPILGGAGVAVSSGAADPRAAAAFVAWLCEGDTQQRIVLAHGGQPAHASVWSSSASPAFFHDTRSSMHDAHVRPAHPAWPAFHRDAGADLAAGLRAGAPPQRIAGRLQERLDAVGTAA